jgi:ABC-2 type transport system permease protein
VAIGLLQLAIILGFGQLLFNVPIRGSVVDLYVAGSAFIAANLALGLLISTATHTQFQAMQVTIFILMPSILLSGFMFPFDGMPVAAQYIGEVLPTTHFIRLTRGIMLREAPIGELLYDFYYLVGFTLVAMTVAAKRFTKRLD